MVEPAQEYLEYLRAQQASPNTVKSYARALALWWQYLDAFGLRWDAVTLADFGAFLTWVDWYNNRRLHGACGGRLPVECAILPWSVADRHIRQAGHWYVALVVMRRVVVQSDGASEAGADNCRRPRVVVGGRWSE
jgi:hypothetical protein